jgi:5-methylcytosine-specific restriction endonuclease McrA
MSYLNNPVLILNKNWTAIDATIVKEAFTDVISKKAKIICPVSFCLHDINSWIQREKTDTDLIIKSTNFSIAVPEVIVSTYNRVPNRKVYFSRRNLWKRDNFRCQYCGIIPAPDEITIDHVVPKSVWVKQDHERGPTCFKNCVLACFDCNKKKKNRTPEEAKMPLIKTVVKNGKIEHIPYNRPDDPKWTPLYAVKKIKHFPQSWKAFLNMKNDDLYWNVQLDES